MIEIVSIEKGRTAGGKRLIESIEHKAKDN